MLLVADFNYITNMRDSAVKTVVFWGFLGFHVKQLALQFPGANPLVSRETMKVGEWFWRTTILQSHRHD